MRELTKYEANLVAKLLEDRAAQCLHHDIEYKKLASGFANPSTYWDEQRRIAADLAVAYRQAGK
jgi:hypothetical protein